LQVRAEQGQPPEQTQAEQAPEQVKVQAQAPAALLSLLRNWDKNGSSLLVYHNYCKTWDYLTL
jgi:hypothetical protein